MTGIAGNNRETALGNTGTYAAKRSATATKTDTPLAKTPQAISVITKEELELKRPSTIKKALAYTPGVMSGSNGSSTLYDNVMMRGFNSMTQNIYLDGMKIQGDMYNEAKIDPYFLDRLEVLRGPASVLYGKSSPGGVIAGVSRRPQTTPVREIRLQAGNHHEWNTGFDFGDTLDDDETFAWRLTGIYHYNHSQQVGERERRYAIAPAFSWQPDENTRVLLLMNFQNEPRTGYYGFLPRTGTVDRGEFGKFSPSFNEGEPGYNRLSRQQRLVTLQFDHDFNENWSFRQIARYQHLSMDWHSIFGLGMCNPMSCQGISPGNWGRTLGRGFIQSQEKLDSFGSDSQLIGKLQFGHWHHTLLMGVDYSRLNNNMHNIRGLAAPLDAANPVYGNRWHQAMSDDNIQDKQNQSGIYLQDQIGWQRWMLTLGGRFDHSTVATHSRGTTNSHTHQVAHEFTSRAGLNYAFENGIAPYISYSESFEPNSGVDRNASSFKPSRGRQYEAGIKYLPEDRPYSASLAVYQLTKDNNLRPDPLSPTTNIQSGKIRSRGIELEGKAALTYNLNLTASYTYTDIHFRDDSPNNHHTPAGVPRQMASMWLDYTFNSGLLQGLTLGGGGRYVSSSNGDDANSFKVNHYALADTAIRYQLDRLGLPDSELALNVNNLFDKHYVSSCFSDAMCALGAERQILTTLTLRF
ncbi:ferrichrome porin FhuA [Salmonella enterica subsp. enterica serovar Choleraesuis]|nr:ferrichrome porin FhuA [Salmonella enterica subsp. enterica serovar Choleraesuis]